MWILLRVLPQRYIGSGSPVGIRSMVLCLFLTSKDPTKVWALPGKHDSVAHRNQQMPEALYFVGINLPPFPQILFQKEYERKSMSGNIDFSNFFLCWKTTHRDLIQLWVSGLTCMTWFWPKCVTALMLFKCRGFCLWILAKSLLL